MKKIKMSKIGALCVICLGLSACDQQNILNNLSGTYYGTKSSSTGSLFVSSNIPSAKTSGEVSELDFQIFNSLASSDIDAIHLQLDSASHLNLSSTLTANTSIPMVVDDKGCAAGKQAAWSIKFCWDAKQVSFEVINSQAISDVRFALTKDSLVPGDDGRATKTYSLDELVGRAKFVNYTVSGEAERVYQSREAIQTARMDLLPRFSLKDVLGLASGDIVGAVGSLLPFIFPTNWYHVGESEDMAQAEEKSFASLRGNEMNAVQNLYYIILRDQLIAGEMDSELSWMRSTQNFLASEEKAGALATGSADYFGVTIASLVQDRTNLGTLLNSEYASLAQSVALPPVNGITALGAIDTTSIDSAKPVSDSDYLDVVAARSFELGTIDNLVSAAKLGVQDTEFSFLNPENGILLSFDMGSKINISQSSEVALEKKKLDLQSLLQEQVANVVQDYNAALTNYTNANAAIKSTKDRINWLIERHLQGDPTLADQDFVDSLTDLQLKVISLKSDKAFAVQSYLAAQSKLDRLTLTGFYKNLDGNSSTNGVK